MHHSYERIALLRAVLALFALTALVVLVFAQVRGFDFVRFDDPAYVIENPHVNTGLSWENAVWAFSNSHAGNWHPLTWLSHMLDVTLFGITPGAHHLVSVFIHWLNSLLVLGLLLVATGRRPGMVWPCFVVAAVFAVHPLRAETVAWVSERKDVLCAFFWLVTMGLYAWHRKQPSLLRYSAVLATMILAMLAKPMAITLPCVLLLMDAWPLRRVPLDASALARLPGLVVEKLPMFALSAALAVATLLAQDAGGAVQSLGTAPLSVRLGNIPVAYVSYLGQLVWPVGLAVSYPLPLDGHPWWRVFLSLAALLAVTAAVLHRADRRPWLPVGWFFYLGTLVPVIGLVQVGDQGMADRYTYLPALGVTAMAVLLATEWLGRAGPRARRGVGIAVLVLVGAMAARAHDQVGTWRDNLTLWSHAAQTVPHSFLAQTNLADALLRAGDIEGAGHHYRRALAAEPELPLAHYNLAVFLRNTGSSDEALEHLDAVLQRNPAHVNARAVRGAALFELGRYAEAEADLRTAIAEEPAHETAASTLAAVLLATDRFAAAAALLEESLARTGPNAVDLTNLALAYAAQGRMERSRPLLEQALTIDPAYSPARNLVRALGGEVIDHEVPR